MDSKWLIQTEIKQEEPVEYYLVSSTSDGVLNVGFDAHSNDEQLAEIDFIQVKEEHSGHTKCDDNAEHSRYTNKESDEEYRPENGTHEVLTDEKKKSTLKWQPEHKFHEVFIKVENVTRKGPPYTCNICSLTFVTKKILKIHRSIHEGKELQCDICKKVFSNKELIYTHMKIHGERKFCCPICKKTFALKKSFIYHQSVHEEKKVECGICSKRFRQKAHMSVHLKTHSERTKDFKCKICVAAYYAQKTLNRHMRLAHSIRHRQRYRCPNTLCDKSFLSLSSFRTHSCVDATRSRSKDFMTVNCSMCSKTFYNNPELNKHVQRMHVRMQGDCKYKCSECNKTFLSRFYDMYVQHVARKCGRATYKCDHCSKVLPSKSKLFKHFIEKHRFVVSPTDVHSCPHCSKLFYNKFNLNHHLKTNHLDLKCVHCHKTFRSQTCYNLHLKQCIPKKTFDKYSKKTNHLDLKCVHCHKTFRSQTGYTLHSKQCIPKKTFDKYSKFVTDGSDRKPESHECNVCKCSFLTMANLLEHKTLVHLEKKFEFKHQDAPIPKYNCSTCSQLFSCQSSLSKHKRQLHKSKKKLTCRTCNVKFMGEGLYEKHLDASECRHRENLQYQCTVCSKVYSRNELLREHFKQMHSSNSQHFECDICGLSFTRKNSIVRHMRRGTHRNTTKE